MERFRINHGNMFSKYDSGSLSRSMDKQISIAINRLSDDYILNVNEEDFIQYLIDEYTLYMPVIHFDDVRIETRKVSVDPEFFPRYWGVQESMVRTMVRYIIPISGDYNILYFCPSTLLSSGSGNFHVGTTEIYKDILAINDDADQVKQDFESSKDSCIKMLGIWRMMCAHIIVPYQIKPDVILSPGKKKLKKKTLSSSTLAYRHHRK